MFFFVPDLSQYLIKQPHNTNHGISKGQDSFQQTKRADSRAGFEEEAYFQMRSSSFAGKNKEEGSPKAVIFTNSGRFCEFSFFSRTAL